MRIYHTSIIFLLLNRILLESDRAKGRISRQTRSIVFESGGGGETLGRAQFVKNPYP